MKIRHTGVVTKGTWIPANPDEHYWIEPYGTNVTLIRKQIANSFYDIVWHNVTCTVSGFRVFKTKDSFNCILDKKLSAPVTAITGNLTFSAPIAGWYDFNISHNVILVSDDMGLIMCGPTYYIDRLHS